MFRIRHPQAPCVIAKATLACGETTGLTIRVDPARSDDDAKAFAEEQLQLHLPGATVISMRVHR